VAWGGAYLWRAALREKGDRMSYQNGPPSLRVEPGMSLERQLLLWGLALAAAIALLLLRKLYIDAFRRRHGARLSAQPGRGSPAGAGLSRLGAAGLLLAVFIVVVGVAGLLLVPGAGAANSKASSPACRAISPPCRAYSRSGAASSRPLTTPC